MRGVADDIRATLANLPGDDDTGPYAQPPSASSRLSAPPPAMAPGGLVARGLSNPPPARSLRLTDPTIQQERRTTTIPPVSTARPDRGTRTLYVLASLALLGAIGYAFWVRAMEQRGSAHPPEVTVPAITPSSTTSPPGSAVAPEVTPSAAPSASATSTTSGTSPTPSAPVSAQAAPSMTAHAHHHPRPTEGTDNPYGAGSGAAKEVGTAPTP
jgi:hypothetical protein